MHGPDILARTMSVARVRRKGTPPWQYHPRSDHHSKVACWGVMFDVLQHSELIRQHVAEGKLGFGINHEMRNFVNGKKKALDLVVCRPKAGAPAPKKEEFFADLTEPYGIVLTDEEQAILSSLPPLPRRPVGAVRIALEAKAAMTEFGKARPRLFDELQSSQAIVHGDTDDAIAAGLVIINAAESFISPTRNLHHDKGIPIETTAHEQPRQLALTVDHINGLPRRATVGSAGFDALGIVVVDCSNRSDEPVRLVQAGGAPGRDHVLHYESMINRIIGWYSQRFPAG